jgi:hypothetical protein
MYKVTILMHGSVVLARTAKYMQTCIRIAKRLICKKASALPLSHAVSRMGHIQSTILMGKQEYSFG